MPLLTTTRDVPGLFEGGDFDVFETIEPDPPQAGLEIGDRQVFFAQGVFVDHAVTNERPRPTAYQGAQAGRAGAGHRHQPVQREDDNDEDKRRRRSFLQQHVLHDDAEADEDDQIEGRCLTREPFAREAGNGDEGDVPRDRGGGLHKQLLHEGGYSRCAPAGAGCRNLVSVGAGPSELRRDRGVFADTAGTPRRSIRSRDHGDDDDDDDDAYCVASARNAATSMTVIVPPPLLPRAMATT